MNWRVFARPNGEDAVQNAMSGRVAALVPSVPMAHLAVGYAASAASARVLPSTGSERSWD